MKKFIVFFICLSLLNSCSDEPSKLTQFTSPYGGTYAVRLPDQVQITENSFTYEVTIKSTQNSYAETKRYKFERMNFHPFTPVFKDQQLEFLHFEYFTLPLDQREAVHKYLADWDAKISNNPSQFTVSNQIIFAECQKQEIDGDKMITTIFRRLNKGDEFEKIYDDLAPFENRAKPIIAYQKLC